MSRTARLFRLMQALRSLPAPVTAEVLAADLGVSARTVYRDIDELRALGMIIDGAAGFGFTLIESATLPPLGFEDDELEALVLGLREVSEIGDPVLANAARQAMGKLRARLPDRQAHRLEHAVLTARRLRPLPVPTVDVAALRQAAWDEETVAFEYVDVRGAATRREVDPLSIAYLDASHCLLAWCHLRRDFRSFRLDRMSALERTGSSFRPNRVPQLRVFVARLKAELAHSAEGRGASG